MGDHSSRVPVGLQSRHAPPFYGGEYRYAREDKDVDGAAAAVFWRVIFSVSGCDEGVELDDALFYYYPPLPR